MGESEKHDAELREVRQKSFLLYLLILVGLGLELRASCLQRRCSTAQVTPPVHFVLLILEIRVL
jgi:hypothetical protein